MRLSRITPSFFTTATATLTQSMRSRFWIKTRPTPTT
jgi:hypothetical protein